MSIHKAIGNNLQQFGGHLECNVCHKTRPLGDVSMKLAHGWPKCCEYTMTWITARQEEAMDIERNNPGIHEAILLEHTS